MTLFRSPLLFFVLFVVWHISHAKPLSEALFFEPANEFKPRTWFHVMSGNMTKAGLTQDLESLAAAGVGGTILFNVSQGVPFGDVVFNSDEHFELVKHMAAESERLGLSFGIHNCDGWTSSGGPWVLAIDSMKKVVWSEALVKGGNVDALLKMPEVVEGYYEDIAVLAYPAFDHEVMAAKTKLSLASSDADADLTLALDGSNLTGVNIDDGDVHWLDLNFDKLYSLRALTVVLAQGRHVEGTLQISKDGDTYYDVMKLTKVRTGKKEWVLQNTFDAIIAKHFRIVSEKPMKVQEVQVSSVRRFDQVLARTSRARVKNENLNPLENISSDFVVDHKKVIDLTSKLDEKGRLKAKLPRGDWTILRFGVTSTGAQNYPASPQGTGLEVDKFNRQALKKHYDAYVGKAVKKIKAVAPNALQYTEIDSYEVGGQNWTHNYLQIFKERFNYELIQYLPVFTGRVVNSVKQTEQVLWDLRVLNDELISENYYGYFDELAGQDGLLSYIEPYGFGPFSDLNAGAKADVPMGEFWFGQEQYWLDAARSSANIYGKNVVAAEAFTARPETNWQFHPGMGKAMGDEAWTRGVNQFFFHRFAHQANVHVQPGMVMNKWGAHFDRTQTWWYGAGAQWFEYMARGQYMLQQGYASADVLVFTGDGMPAECTERNKLSEFFPRGLNFDCINSDVLQNSVHAKDGRAILATGATYRFLWLKNIREISNPTLAAIEKIAKAGVVIVGEKPHRLAQWQVDKEAQQAFKKKVEAIWSAKNVFEKVDWKTQEKKVGYQRALTFLNDDTMGYVHRKVGQQEIFFFANAKNTTRTLETRFKQKKLQPEIWDLNTGTINRVAEFQVRDNGLHIDFTLQPSESVMVVLREPLQQLHVTRSQTPGDVALTLAQKSLQVASFAPGRHKFKLSNGEQLTLKVPALSAAIELNNDWQVQFEQAYDFEQMLHFESLIDWSLHPSEKVRYYSGGATYTRSFQLDDAHVTPGNLIRLSLGEVELAATVTINGHSIPTSWVAPHQMDITDWVKAGENTLSIHVVNAWTNRLIGDERYPRTDGYVPSDYFPTLDQVMPRWYVENKPLPEGKRSTFTTASFYSKDDPLLPSGLIGPVRVQFGKQFELLLRR